MSYLSRNLIFKMYIVCTFNLIFFQKNLQHESNVKLGDHLLGYFFVNGNFEHEFGGS
jgi:hypothetical protein